MKTIDTGESGGGQWCPSLIRADPSTGQIGGGTKQETCEIFSFNENGTKIQTAETKEVNSDFFIDELRQFFFFCNYEGIFIFFPEKIIQKFV